MLSERQTMCPLDCYQSANGLMVNCALGHMMYSSLTLSLSLSRCYNTLHSGNRNSLQEFTMMNLLR